MKRRIPASLSVLDVVEARIRETGCDGLYSPSGECGCLVDVLGPCGGIKDDCVLAIKVDYPHRECPGGDCDGECDYHLFDAGEDWSDRVLRGKAE